MLMTVKEIVSCIKDNLCIFDSARWKCRINVAIGSKESWWRKATRLSVELLTGVSSLLPISTIFLVMLVYVICGGPLLSMMEANQSHADRIISITVDVTVGILSATLVALSIFIVLKGKIKYAHLMIMIRRASIYPIVYTLAWILMLALLATGYRNSCETHVYHNASLMLMYAALVAIILIFMKMFKWLFDMGINYDYDKVIENDVLRCYRDLHEKEKIQSCLILEIVHMFNTYNIIEVEESVFPDEFRGGVGNTGSGDVIVDIKLCKVRRKLKRLSVDLRNNINYSVDSKEVPSRIMIIPKDANNSNVTKLWSFFKVERSEYGRRYKNIFEMASSADNFGMMMSIIDKMEG